MKKAFIALSLVFALIGGFIAPVHAQYGLQETAQSSGLDKTSPGSIPELIGNIVGTALSLIGVLFFLLMVYGGFLWMTAHGKGDQVEKAQETIIAAVIGIIVVLASYAITSFVFSSVNSGQGTGVTSGGGPNGGNTTPNSGAECDIGLVGNECTAVAGCKYFDISLFNNEQISVCAPTETVSRCSDAFDACQARNPNPDVNRDGLITCNNELAQCLGI